MDVFRPLWCGKGSGGSWGGDVGGVREHLYTYCLRGCHTIRLWGQMKQKKGKHFSNTHMHLRLHIDPVSLPMEVVFFFKYTHIAVHTEEPDLKELTLQLQTKPKAQKAHPHSAECRTTAAEHCDRLSTLHLKGESFQLHCQLLGFNAEVVRNTPRNTRNNQKRIKK